jgi:hypothetical protein
MCNTEEQGLWNEWHEMDFLPNRQSEGDEEVQEGEDGSEQQACHYR